MSECDLAAAHPGKLAGLRCLAWWPCHNAPCAAVRR